MNINTRTLRAVFTAVAIASACVSASAAKIFVIGGKPDDPFWSIVKRGAEDAGIVAKAQGGSVTWLGPQNYDNLGVDAAELIRQAIAQGAEGIVGPNWVPEAMDPAFKAVVAAKIPLVIYNAGGIGAAVAFDHNAVEAQKHGPIVIIGVQMVLEQLCGRARDQEADLRTQ